MHVKKHEANTVDPDWQSRDSPGENRTKRMTEICKKENIKYLSLMKLDYLYLLVIINIGFYPKAQIHSVDIFGEDCISWK